MGIIVLIGGLFFWFASHSFEPGGGGESQLAPDTVKVGESAIVEVKLSVWGGGGPIKGRYTDVNFYYRLVGQSSYNLLKSNPIPIVFTGDQQQFNDQYELYTFAIPLYPKGTVGQIEYYHEAKLDGIYSRVDGIKKIKIIE